MKSTRSAAHHIDYTRNTCMQQPLATNQEHATIFSELHEVLV